MRVIWLLALNDLRLTAKDRPALIWMIIMPIAMMAFFGMMGGGGSNTTPLIALTIDNQDSGWLGDAFVAELEARQLEITSLADVDVNADANAAESPVRVLHLPAGLTDGVLGGDPQTLRLETREDASMDFTFAAQVNVFRAIVTTLGRLVELGQGGGVPDADRFARLASREPLVAADVSMAGRGTPVPSGTAQSVPGMLTMMVMMMTLIYGAVFLTQEKQQGMLRRQTVMPFGRGTLIAGKLFGRVLIGGVQTAILLLAGRFLFGVHYGSSGGALLLLLVSYVAAVAGLSTWLGAVARDAGQASAIGWIGSLVMAAVGGCWWPAEVMPEWMRAASRIFPTSWAMDGFHQLISFGHGFDGVWLPSLALFGFAAVSGIAGARHLRVD